MADHEPQAAEAKSGGSSMMKLIAAAGFLMLIVGVELAVAFIIFPSADDVLAMAQAQQGGHAEAHSEAADDEHGDGHEEDAHGDDHGDGHGGGHGEKGHAERVEVDLGGFSVSAFQPLSNTTIRIDFQLYGVVLAEDAETITKLLEEHQHRFREQVLVIMRSAEMSDLTDAGLGLIKRKILEKTNRTLSKALLKEVLFSDFSFVEQ